MVTDTGQTVENLEEYFKNRPPQIGCTTQQVCPNCGAILYDSPCFHFFSDCPRCGHHEDPIWMKYPPITENTFQFIKTEKFNPDDYNFKFQG